MKNIIVYSTPTCMYCKMAKAYLAERGIKYIEKDVSTDEEAREEMIKKSGQLGVPVIDVDGTVVIGFDKERLSTLIGK